MRNNFSIPRSFKMYPIRATWFEKKPSGNPAELSSLLTVKFEPHILQPPTIRRQTHFEMFSKHKTTRGHAVDESNHRCGIF
jgi:hypothetical protein